MNPRKCNTALQFNFNRDDYEKAIARIVNEAGHVVGTGFLVAPGYVLTCAHVVLQAIGINKEEFDKYEGQPEQSVRLTFHVLQPDMLIEAQVVTWCAYSVSSGDIAGLKLRSPEPETIPPIPLSSFALSDIESQSHSVYGFGESANGGRSDAYQPKANVAGKRFQFCRVGDPNDETIKAGFSGAPVWNDERDCVIGMVATAIVKTKAEQKSTAYAIPTKVLQPFLQRLSAYHLDDVLIQCIEAMENEQEQRGFERAIAIALKRCNPNADLTEANRISQLLALLDLPPNLGWEREGRLAQFAMTVDWMEGTPVSVSEALETWIIGQSFDYPQLCVRMQREMKQKHISASGRYEHVMVEVSPDEQEAGQIRVSIWGIDSRATYDPLNPPEPDVYEQVMAFDDLACSIYEYLDDIGGAPQVHVFVPLQWLDYPLDTCEIDDDGVILGSDRPLVMRINLNVMPTKRVYYDRWREKWQNVEENWDKDTIDILHPAIDCSCESMVKVVKAIRPREAAILKGFPAIGPLFRAIVKRTALPVALWVRDGEVREQLPDLLNGTVRSLPERICEERAEAEGEEDVLLGHHLSLVWEDPNVVPPTMQFDPEAC